MIEEEGTLVEINGGRQIWVVTFSVDGDYLFSGDDEAVRVWLVANGREVKRMPLHDVRSIAASRNGRQIAAGTELGRFIVWDAQTYEMIFTHKSSNIKAIDFSPNSARLATGSSNCTVSVWDFITHKRVLGPLHHPHAVIAAKYSLQGDQFVTACADPGSVRIYDSHSGQVLVDIAINVAMYCNVGPAWSSNGQHLFVLSDGKIKQLQAPNWSVVEEWPVQDYRNTACITLSKRGEFIAYASKSTVNFLAASTGIQLGQGAKYDQEVHSIALSPDDRVLATCTRDRKIIIRSLQGIIPLEPLTPSSHGPFIHVCGAVLDSWTRGQLDKAKTLLTERVESEDQGHHAYAHRALILSRLQLWHAANEDAEKSIDIQPSAIGFIAKGVALVGLGKKLGGYAACDFAFRHCPSNYVDTLLAVKAVLMIMAGEYDDAISRVSSIIAVTQDSPMYQALQAYMRLLYGRSCFERRDYTRAIELFELAQAQISLYDVNICQNLEMISLISGWHFDDVYVNVKQALCEALYAAGRTQQAGETLLEAVTHVTNMTGPTTEWICGFIQRCLSTSQGDDEATSEAGRQGQAMTPQVPISSLGLSTSVLLLAAWTRIKLASASWKDTLVTANGFTVPRIVTYRVTCERLVTVDRLVDAINCFHEMENEPVIRQGDEAKWIPDFRNRCSRKLESLGDTAANAQQHAEAVSRYSAALSLKSTTKEALLAKRSKAYIAMGSLMDALNDANEIIELDPLSPEGYERKYAALRGTRRYNDAIDAYKMMLSKMSQSSHLEIQDRVRQYVRPEDTEAAIRKIVEDTVRNLPRVLINTTTGRLLNQLEQASMFESSEVFKELVSAMTTHINATRIEQEVAQYYRYATLSHTWEENEPLFEHVVHILVYDLEKSPTRDKLRMFCKIVRDSGFNWAWSDNCCINKQKQDVRDEALVAMFRWYEGAAVVIVFLRGVRSPSKRGDLVKSKWNTRAWTFQEYLAAKVVRFYTEDWMPYLNNDIPNHKDSPEITLEMEEATNIPATALRTLRPGLDDIREKLFLASGREATYAEDKAYSLFGIFGVSMVVRYGEGNMALGRLLAYLLASSGDMAILSWTGKSGGFNSCLPADIIVFSQPPTHIPLAPRETSGDAATFAPRVLSRVLDAATTLYDQLCSLPFVSVSGKRITIPCIIFKLGPLQCKSDHTFRARADALGAVEIKATDDLSQLKSLYLIHPWIDFLLDRQPVGGGADEFQSCDSPSTSNIPLISQRTPTVASRIRQSLDLRWNKSNHDLTSLASPSRTSLTDKRTQVLQFISRLRQPFGPLLLTPCTRGHFFRRVATDSELTAQIREDLQLSDLKPHVRMLNLL